MHACVERPLRTEEGPGVEAVVELRGAGNCFHTVLPVRKSSAVKYQGSVVPGPPGLVYVQISPLASDISLIRSHGPAPHLHFDKHLFCSYNKACRSSSTQPKKRRIGRSMGSLILYYVAFVERGEVRRIISLRRANRREVRRYVENA